MKMTHSCTSERAYHGNIYIGLVPQGGRVQKKTGGMVENDIGEIPRPKENATGNYT